MDIVLQTVITIFGIMLNVLGAWYISRCLINKTEYEMKKETVACYSWNDNYVLSGIKQKIEGNWGITYIGLGAMLQIGSLIFNKKAFIFSSFLTWLSITIIISILILSMSLLFIRTNIGIKKKYIHLVKSYIIKHRPIHDKINIKDIVRYINYVDSDYKAELFSRAEVVEKFNNIFKLPESKVKLDAIKKLKTNKESYIKIIKANRELKKTLSSKNNIAKEEVAKKQKTKKDGSQSTEKFFNWIKNHKLKVLLVILLFTIIIVPIIINLSFVKNGIILVKWEAKDVLIYYGSVLAFLGTSFLGALTLYLSNKNSSANKKLMEMQYISQNEILIETPQENEASVYLEEQDVSHRGGYSVLQLEADDTNSLWFYSKIDLSSNSNNISFRVKHLQFHAFINPQKIPPNFFRYKNSEEDFSPLYVISENNKYYSRVGIIIYMSEDLYNRVIKQEGLLINGEIEVLTGAEIIRIYQFNIMFINKIIESDYTEISRGFKKTLQYYIRTTEKRD